MKPPLVRECRRTGLLIAASAFKSLLKAKLEQDWLAYYLTNIAPDHTHRRASKHGHFLDWERLTRPEPSRLHQLTLNRPPFLQARKKILGKIHYAVYPHCHLENEDSHHFLCTCPHWDKDRANFIDASPRLAYLQSDPISVVRFLRSCALFY
jgi:hypothetical protein